VELLVNLIGNAGEMIKNTNLNNQNIKIIKIDEKDLAKPKKIIKLLKSGDYSNVYFGTIDLRFLRFEFFMKLYMILTLNWKGKIIDEKGNQIKFNILHFIFIDIPKIIIEIIASVWYIIFHHFKVLIILWKYKKK
jgi:hypothetical protein